MNPITIPKSITESITALNALVEQHPQYLPLPEVAKFIGANANGLRNSIEKGQCPFGLQWQKSLNGNKAFKIPTVTFYLWYTQGVGYRNFNDSAAI
jgi:hypothetical protein